MQGVGKGVVIYIDGQVYLSYWQAWKRSLRINFPKTTPGIQNRAFRKLYVFESSLYFEPGSTESKIAVARGNTNG